VRQALAAAALLALAWPAGARAADLGGGSPARGLGGYRGQLTLVSLRTVPGRAVVRALVAARCGVGAIKARANVAADGTFAVSAVKRDRDPDEAGVRRVARVVVTGRVTGVTATGTARTKITLSRSGHVVERCRTGARTWQARTPVAETMSDPPHPPHASRGYFGLTGQTTHPRAIVLRVGAGADHVQPVAFDYALDCDMRTREGHNITPGGPIAADGSFHLAERFMLRFSNASERYRVKVSGRFTLHGVRGTLSVTSVARSLAGAVIERCHTGSVPFVGAL
jgi:hypothetical protein